MRYRIEIEDTNGRVRPWFDDNRRLTESEALTVAGFIQRHFPQYQVNIHTTVRASKSMEVAA